MRPGRVKSGGGVGTRIGASTRSNTPTTPASGSVNKSKSVVRFEKFNKKDEKTEKKDESIERKMSGPLKKRVITSTPVPPVKRGRKSNPEQNRSIAISEDLSDYNLVTARARRTPKPNPKYSSEEVVTNYAKEVKRGKSGSEESERDDFDSAEDFEGNSTDMKEEDIVDTDDSEEHDSRKIDKSSYSRGRNKITTRTVNKSPEIGKITFTSKRKFGSSRDSTDSPVTAYNKRLNLEMYDASDSDASTSSPTLQRVLRNASTGRSSSLLKPVEKSFRRESPKSKPIQILERRKENIKRQSNDDDCVELTSKSGVSDESMPTFTIVNINDIINKKADDILNIDNIRSEGSKPKSAWNRQKTELSSPSPPRSPYPAKKLSKILNNNTTKSLLKNTSIKATTEKKKAVAPRILNSVVAKKTRPVSPIVSAKQTRITQPIAPKPIVSQKQSKENLSSSNKSLQSTNITVSPPASKKLPSGQVILQRQGNRLIKKVTCFENWNVIHFPETKEKIPTYTFDFSIVYLGNHINEVTLPNKWTYKITLQKLSWSQINKPGFEKYTGEVKDPNISENDKMKYQPTCIMFRRVNKSTGLPHAPFDRAVIIKNSKFYVNVNGKNVQLIGAPVNLKTIEDVNILIDILNYLPLQSDFIQPVLNTL